MKEGPVKEYTVTDMNNLGNGIAKDERGKVVFIPGAIDGEQVKAGVIKEASDYSVARLEEITVPSPHRRNPDCAAYKKCGGCVFRHIAYEHELKLKRGFVSGAFAKNRMDITPEEVRTTDKTAEYRNKVQYPIDEDYRVGYYMPHSHRMVEESITCPLAKEFFGKIVSFSASLLKERKIKGVKNIYIRHAEGTGQIMLCFVSSEKKQLPEDFIRAIVNEFPGVTQIAQNYQPLPNNVILGEETVTLYGKDIIADKLCGLTYFISPTSFYQVNHDACELLYETAFDLLSPKDGERVGDLYCGTGTIGIYIASRIRNAKIIGVEIVEEAVKAAEINAKINNISNAEFTCADAANGISLASVDTFIVDPPRKGLSQELTEIIKNSGKERFVYVSCNPETLARDCKLLEDNYKIERIVPVDMFPRTGHVETVVRLSRSDMNS